MYTHIHSHTYTHTHTHTHKVTKALSLSEQRRNQISKYFLFDQILSFFLSLSLSFLSLINICQLIKTTEKVSNFNLLKPLGKLKKSSIFISNLTRTKLVKHTYGKKFN